jgi:hypothetical protein
LASRPTSSQVKEMSRASQSRCTAATKYEKNGQEFWRVYLDLRGKKDSRVRVQKRVNGFKSEREALAEEKRLLRSLLKVVNSTESKGVRWVEVIERWGTGGMFPFQASFIGF